MKGATGRLTRIAIAALVAVAIVGVAALTSSTFAAPRTVTTTSTLTSTASLTVTQIVVSNRTVTVNVTEGRTYALLVNPQATVRGQAVAIPGCAVHGGCTSIANQSSTAMLILFSGTYYYVSNYTFTGSTNVLYTVWYTNSTEYCVSPAVPWDPVCPNAALVRGNPTQTTTSTSCTVSGEGGPLFLQVATDQGAPVQGQHVKVVHMGPKVNGQYCGTASLPTLITNSTGWAKVPGGDGLPYAGSFALTFGYSGQTYNATITIYPLTATYVSFYVTSGREVTTYCPVNNCMTTSDTMMMGG